MNRHRYLRQFFAIVYVADTGEAIDSHRHWMKHGGVSEHSLFVEKLREGSYTRPLPASVPHAATGSSSSSQPSKPSNTPKYSEKLKAMFQATTSAPPRAAPASHLRLARRNPLRPNQLRPAPPRGIQTLAGVGRRRRGRFGRARRRATRRRRDRGRPPRASHRLRRRRRASCPAPRRQQAASR